MTVDELKAYENQLKRIFKKMIANDLAFELNSKSMYLYHHEGLYRYVLALVRIWDVISILLALMGINWSIFV